MKKTGMGSLVALLSATFFLTSLVSASASFADAADIQTSTIAAGGAHTCAVVSGGVKCWGANWDGQLGDGTRDSKSSPTEIIAADSGVTAISAGNSHTCAVVSGGVKCWGANWSGHLGDGTYNSKSSPTEIIAADSGVTAISAGSSHTCAVVSGGVKCWGANWSGQLGDGTRDSKSSPTEIIAADSGVTAISAGNSHTCAVVSGGVKCWGSLEDGKIGNGHSTRFQNPINVPDVDSFVTTISAGNSHTCAVVSGGVKCWGANWDGQLGDGTRDSKSSPTEIIAADSGVTAISAGGSHTCAVVSGGVKCWGANWIGHLGDGTYNSKSSPTEIIAADSGVTAISAGSSHTCAVVSGGVKCWGANWSGQLGDGTRDSKSSPTEIIAADSGVTAISAGSGHTCAVVSGGVKCWGSNSNGRMGRATSVLAPSSFQIEPIFMARFNSKGGSSVVASSFVTDGSLTAPTAPTRVGYTFMGWSATDGGSAIDFPYSPGVLSDITLYALWSADSHSVTFNSNGGSSVASGSFVTDGSLSAPSAPTRSGYTFMGWSSSNGAVVFPYSPAETTDITLDALWSADSHVVTFNSKGGPSVVAGSFVTDGSVSAPSAPTRAGYSFLGWSATDGGSSVAFPYSPDVTTDITLFAKWSPNSHKVTFNSMRGSNVAPGSFVTDGYVNAPAAPLRAGYSFAGWSLTDGGSAVSFPYSPSVIGDITLYAKWSFIYKVTFNTKGGNAIAASSFVDGGSITAPISPTRAGYSFAGWSVTDGGSAVSFPYSPGVSAAVTLYSLWSANSNTVTFNSKGGSSVEVGSFSTGGSLVSPSAPTRAGYTFAGWSLTDGGSAVSFPYSPGVTQDIKLYARWNANGYAVLFNSMGGSSVNAGSFITGGTVAAPASPTRTGYLFAGWSTSENGALVKFPYKPVVTQNVILFAKWTALVPKLSVLTSGSIVGGSAIQVQVTGANEGLIRLEWANNANGGTADIYVGADGSTKVANIVTPTLAGTYTVVTSVWTGQDSHVMLLSRTVVIGKAVSISAKVTSSNPSAKKASLTISGATKFGAGYVASKTLSVSLMRNGIVVAVTEATTDSNGLFSVTLPGSSYQAGDYTALVSYAADSQYWSATATTAKVTLR